MAAQAVAPPPSPGRTPPLASLYVGDLDPQATEIDLFETFRQMGPLASVRLCRDRLSHQSLRYAYVNFFSPSDGTSLTLRAFSLGFLSISLCLVYGFLKRNGWRLSCFR